MLYFLRKIGVSPRIIACVRRVLYVALGIFAIFCLLVQYFGGKGVIPTWEQCYRATGVYNASPAVEPAGDRARIHFIDVWQGDAVLIEQDGLFAMVDAGTNESKENVVQYLKETGVEKLDLMVMTHPHEDHIGGMDAVLRSVDVAELWIPDFSQTGEPDSLYYNEIIEEAREKQVRIRTPQEGSHFSLGSGDITLISDGVPVYNLTQTAQESGNDVSLCVRFDAGEFSFLDTGDGEKATEQKLLKNGQPLYATLFKAAHHGSKTSNTEAFLQAVHPEAVVVSCGRENPHGHPADEVLQTFQLVGAEVYRTDWQGNVTVTADKSGKMQIDTQREYSEP